MYYVSAQSTKETESENMDIKQISRTSSSVLFIFLTPKRKGKKKKPTGNEGMKRSEQKRPNLRFSTNSNPLTLFGSRENTGGETRFVANGEKKEHGVSVDWLSSTIKQKHSKIFHIFSATKPNQREKLTFESLFKNDLR